MNRQSSWREISTLNRRWKIYHVCKDTFRHRIDVEKYTMSAQILFDVESTSNRRKKSTLPIAGKSLNRREFDVEKYMSTWWPFFNVESTYILRRIFYADVDYVHSTCIARCRSHRTVSTRVHSFASHKWGDVLYFSSESLCCQHKLAHEKQSMSPQLWHLLLYTNKCVHR